MRAIGRVWGHYPIQWCVLEWRAEANRCVEIWEGPYYERELLQYFAVVRHFGEEE
jgi:hypothetical protein